MPAKNAAESERQRAVFREVDAHDLGGKIVIADRDHRPAVAGAYQIGDEQEADHEIGEHHIEILLVAAEGVAENRERIGAGRHRAAGKPLRAREEVEQDILRGKRRDDEIKPLQPCRWKPEDQPDQSRHHAREWNGEEHRNRCVVRDIGRTECAEQEEGGVTDRDLAGEADEHVQAECCDRKDADLDRDAQPVIGEDQRREAHRDDAENRKVAAGRGRKDRGVRRVRGAEVAGRDEGGACHQELYPLDVFGAEQAVGFDHQDDDQHIERRDLVKIAPVQIFAVDILGDVFEKPDDDAAEHRAAD